MVLTLLLGIASLTLRTADGRTETLFPSADRRATVVLVTIAECPVARGYSPELARLAKAYRAKGVRFVMAFVGAGDAAIRTQMREYALGFPGARADRRLVAFLGARTAPTAAVVSADGRLVYSGRIDDRFPALGVQRPARAYDLRRALDQYLAGRPVVPARTTVVGCAIPNG